MLAANPNVQATSSVNLESRILAVFAGRILHRTLGERNARVARRQNKHDFVRMREHSCSPDAHAHTHYESRDRGRGTGVSDTYQRVC